jgi:hypothetical protein
MDSSASRAHDEIVLTPAQIAVIDRFGRLYLEKQAFGPKLKELETLAAVIRFWYSDLPADQTALAIGTQYEVQVGEKSIEKDWTSMPAVSEACGGLQAFYELCTVTFKALSGVVGDTAAAALQTEERTGSRTLKAVPILSDVLELPKAA